VIIRATTDDGGSRLVEAEITAEGDLIISGQDLGPSVGAFWGTEFTEYEYAHTIERKHVTSLLKALGSSDGDDVIDVLRQKYTDPTFLLRAYLEPETAVPFTFWSRLGD
jgi:hypothetical protein